MEKRDQLIILYDYYETLLTPLQQKYFQDYYFNNYTLGEISENDNISRNAVHHTLKTIENKLYTYEEKLKLYEKKKKLQSLLKNIKDKEIVDQINDLY